MEFLSPDKQRCQGVTADLNNSGPGGIQNVAVMGGGSLLWSASSAPSNSSVNDAQKVELGVKFRR